jgi:hypothetical protein
MRAYVQARTFEINSFTKRTMHAVHGKFRIYLIVWICMGVCTIQPELAR